MRVRFRAFDGAATPLGPITVMSELGTGSTFTLVLPAA
jgi:hypothetical protein